MDNILEIQKQLMEVTSLISNLHSSHPLKESNSVRGHDKTTPYYTHPIACAYMVMEDNNSPFLDFNTRYTLALTLLCHDVLEDTYITELELKIELDKILLNDSLVNKVISLTTMCTIDKNMNSMDEFKELKNNKNKYPEEFWYIKTIDKWFNLFGSKDYFLKKGTLLKYIDFLVFLVSQLEKTRYKKSMFVSQSKALCKELKKINNKHIKKNNTSTL
jgi:hypothetical protein